MEEEMSKVADLKAKFSQDPGGIGKPPTAARRPPVTTKPKVAHKSPKSPGHTNGSAKPVPLMPNGLQKELGSVRLKSHDRPATSPRADRTSDSSESSIPEWRTLLKPVSPGGPGKPSVTLKPGAKPPPVSHKPSIGSKPRVANKPSDSGIESDGRDHSASGSFGSIKSDTSQDSGDKERGSSFRLAPLPPLEMLGPAPRKPRKPARVKLPPPTGVKTRKPDTPKRTTPATPALPPRSPEPPRVPEPSRVPEYPGHPAEADDFQETYDDVGAPPPVPSTANRPSLNKNRVSLIPTMDSGDEMEPNDELYDEGISAPITSDEGYTFPPPPLSLTLGPPPPPPGQTLDFPAPPLPLAPLPGPLPGQTSTISDFTGPYSARPLPPPGLNLSRPPPPGMSTLPAHAPQTSASSSSSNYPQTSGTSENTGSGDDCGEIYDPVDEDNDCDELYEPLDMDDGGGGGGMNPPGPDAAELEKEREAERKKQEKLKKDQERQQKKEEEKRKKEEKEEKKRKEKADKEFKKKFKLKGDWTVMEIGYAMADLADESDKLQVICTKGDTLEIIRKGSPNPKGKWLVRNTLGDPGYINAELVQTSSDDFGDEYDAVGVDDADDFQDIYDDAI